MVVMIVENMRPEVKITNRLPECLAVIIFASYLH